MVCQNIGLEDIYLIFVLMILNRLNGLAIELAIQNVYNVNLYFCGGGCLVRSLRKSGEISFGNCNEYPQSFKYLMKTVCKEILENNYDVL